jgi:CRP/FNR family cyclic AMP-dependent transcriptional regulator
MSSLSVFDLLALHDFAADLPAAGLHRLAACGRCVYHPTGHRLTREEGPADRFWLVRSGGVAIDFHVPGRGDIVVERLGADSVVGWSWLLPPYRWRFGAIVSEDIRALEFDGPRVRALIDREPEFGRQLQSRFLTVMADRLQAARHRLLQLYAVARDPAELR